ncbi:PREDICTED: cold-regulated 413 plasma membrane protein 3-like [Camelina sativa]|uniref:Cold-regulated 413 plasma membrane protein 3-like n=1 Tax=Camelina sativa TaxID=90675 RepID=A0ABM0WKF7_CAMSA|nr:PREDICTED: cold-regulated 413 plasma membrane protein 3-like [Camelina sativa]
MEKIEFQVAAEKLSHSNGVLVIITLFLRWVACFAAVFLMILDGTKWKYPNNMLTSLLAPYLFASLPLVIFHFFRAGFGKWIALLTVVLRLFLPNHFPELLEIPSATILFIVATPRDLVDAFRDDLKYTGGNVSLLTSFYLLDRHTKACGGFKNSFTQKDKLTFTICLYILSFYPFFSAFASLFY